MTAKLRVAGSSDPGKIRSLNEDRYYFRFVQASDQPAIGLFLVADGLGGYLAGEVASHWAVETVKREMAQLFEPFDDADTKRVRPQELWNPPDSTKPADNIQAHSLETLHLISYAIKKANEVLLSYAQQKPAEAGGMGSTMAVVVIKEGLATVANLGDSRVYLWRHGRLYQITTDHTLPGELSARGHLAPREIPSHPQRHILQRCLGRHILVEPDIFRPIKLESKDKLLLCSDGLWNMLTPNQRIEEIMSQQDDVETLVGELIRLANEAGGEDNITVVIASVEAQSKGEPVEAS